MKQFKRIALFVSLAFVMSVAQSCGEKTDSKPMKGVFTFVKGSVQVNNTDTNVGQKVTKNDTIMVNEDSGAVLQFSKDAAITLSANTVLKVAQLSEGENGKPQIKLRQDDGSTFSKVLTKGSDYKVTTQTLVAGVRGTRFNVTVDSENKNRSSVQLLEGEVEVAPSEEAQAADPKQADKKVTLKDGEQVVAENDNIQEKSKLQKEQIETLQKFDNSISVLKAEEIASSESLKAALDKPEQKEADKAIGNLTSIEVPQMAKKSTQTAAKQTQKQQQLTLEDLRQKYGNLAKITTEDGKEYIGHFEQKGNKMEIITTDGKVVVDNVANISQY